MAPPCRPGTHAPRKRPAALRGCAIGIEGESAVRVPVLARHALFRVAQSGGFPAGEVVEALHRARAQRAGPGGRRHHGAQLLLRGDHPHHRAGERPLVDLLGCSRRVDGRQHRHQAEQPDHRFRCGRIERRAPGSHSAPYASAPRPSARIWIWWRSGNQASSSSSSLLVPSKEPNTSPKRCPRVSLLRPMRLCSAMPCSMNSIHSGTSSGCR